MGILVGMDEAGYGPNLGPLVVAATVWEVDAGGRGQGAGSKKQGAGGREQRAGESARPLRGIGGATLTTLSPVAGSGGSTATFRTPHSALRIPNDDLYHALQEVVDRQARTDDRIAIADSKSLYKPGGGLRQLERAVHAALAALDRTATCWSQLVGSLGADPAGAQRRLPWHADFDCRLPVDANTDEVTALGARLSEVSSAAGVQPVDVRARMVFPAEFNELIGRYGSKGAALSHVTLSLLRSVLESLRGDALEGLTADSGSALDRRAVGSRLESSTPPLGATAGLSSSAVVGRRNAGGQATRGTLKSPIPHSWLPAPCPLSPVSVVCDKHGGRNRYGPLLQHHFPDDWVETLTESRAESCYQWGPPESRVEVSFRTSGEAFLPAALASMTAKYLRELAMQALNAFWSARVPGLRPTAGYPVDARRFKAEISAVQRSLEIDDDILWRCR